MTHHKRAAQVPADGIRGLLQHGKTDLVSGFILFLIALPLSVGISIASGAPPSAGLLAAVVGGVIGGLLSGSYVTINGPAAGLIVIVAGAIQSLALDDPSRAFPRALAAFAVAGAIQILFGLLRLGSLGLAFPTSVIHGMMMAIGVIIMSKQAHVMLGVSPEAKSILGLIAEIPHSVRHMNPDIALIGFGSVAILLLWPRLGHPWLKKVPGVLVAVIYGIAMGLFFDLEHEHTVHVFMENFVLGPSFLLNIPNNISEALVRPDFSLIGTGVFWKAVISVALVASIESVLSSYAVDKLDPYRRISHLDRDLAAKGVCNLVLGLIGGIPVISEIVRSSANIANGARTRWSNVFHGLFILFFLVAFPHLLHEIPLAALAAVLMVVGFRLGNPAQLGSTWNIGWDQFLVFFTTFVATITYDLLVGVAFGLGVEFILHVFHHPRVPDLFRISARRSNRGGKVVLEVSGPVVFSNFLGLKKKVANEKQDQEVVLDLTGASWVDHTMMEHLERFVQDFRAEGRQLELLWSDNHRGVSRHPLASRKLKR